MNVKKFSLDKSKKIKQQKFLKQNKQNICSVDDSKFKQFSVDLHKLSMDCCQPMPKNITKQNISIFLQSQSQNKTFVGSGKGCMLQVQIRKLTQKIENEGLANIYQQDQWKSQQVKRLVHVIGEALKANKCQTGKYKGKKGTVRSNNTSERSIQESFITAQAISPYLEQQLTLMQQQLQQLQLQNSQFKQFKNIQKQQKSYIKHTLQTVYQRQLLQLGIDSSFM